MKAILPSIKHNDSCNKVIACSILTVQSNQHRVRSNCNFPCGIFYCKDYAENDSSDMKMVCLLGGGCNFHSGK